MKICIIGNSHAGCIYKAWEEMKEIYPSTAVSFHIRKGGYFARYVADKDKGILGFEAGDAKNISMYHSGDTEDIFLDEFDACVIVGGFLTQIVGELAVLVDSEESTYSKQVVEAAIHDYWAKIHVRPLVDQIRKLSDIPVYLVPAPFLSPKIESSLDDLVYSFSQYSSKRAFERLNETVLTPIGVELLQQPDETLETPYFTKKKFAILGRKPYPAEIEAGFKGELINDYVHMNKSYGKVRLKAVFDKLGIIARFVR